jgi:integrase
MFRLGFRDGIVGTTPHITMLQENNARKGFFEHAEFLRLLDHLPAALKPLIHVAYITGWRMKSELLTREWKHVDFVNRKLRIEPGEDKNRAGREFPFTPELEQILKQQRARAAGIARVPNVEVSHVFFWDDGSPIRSYRKRWDDAREACGLDRVPHDFRRTAVRNLEQAGVPRSAAMKMVGHKTEAIYRRYAIVDEAMLRDGADKLAAFHERQAAAGKKPRGARPAGSPASAR